MYDNHTERDCYHTAKRKKAEEKQKKDIELQAFSITTSLSPHITSLVTVKRRATCVAYTIELTEDNIQIKTKCGDVSDNNLFILEASM